MIRAKTGSCTEQEERNGASAFEPKHTVGVGGDKATTALSQKGKDAEWNGKGVHLIF